MAGRNHRHEWDRGEVSLQPNAYRACLFRCACGAEVEVHLLRSTVQPVLTEARPGSRGERVMDYEVDDLVTDCERGE